MVAAKQRGKKREAEQEGKSKQTARLTSKQVCKRRLPDVPPGRYVTISHVPSRGFERELGSERGLFIHLTIFLNRNDPWTGPRR